MKTTSEQRLDLPDTLPKLLRYHYHKFGTTRIAMREKDRGIWNKYTWSDYYSIVQQMTMAFVELGLQPDEKVAIIGENKPHVYWVELAALTCRAPVLGIFSDCTSAEIKYFLTHSDSRYVICQDQEQVDKVLEIQDEIPEIRRIIYWEEKGMWNYDHPLLITLDDMLEMGQKRVKTDPDRFSQMIDETDGDDVAVFFYTSGTTGLPKAGMQTHRNIKLMVELMDRREPVLETDQSVSYLPIAWIAEQLQNVGYSLYKGFTVNFPESQDTIQENIREIGPHMVLFAPQNWEDFIRGIRVKMADAGWLNQLCFNAALKVGYRVGDARMKGQKAALWWRLLHLPAEWFVFSPLKDKLGIKRGRIARVGGTAISPDVIRYFQALGMPLVQVYGSSECGIATMHPRNQIKAETSGTPLDTYEIKLSEEGEILVKSPCMFKGYYKNEEKTAKVLVDGWYYTGDFGNIDADGHLIVMDRMDDLQPIAGDRKFSPQYAETRLRFSPYIKNALVVGSGEKDYAVTLVNVDYDNVGHWAESNRIVYTTFLDLSQKEGVIGLIQKEIDTINASLPAWARIKKFINLHKEFDPDEAELTRTRKIRRDFIKDKYKELVDGLFSEKDKIEITASVTYRDGTKGETRSSLSINNVY
ncbi:MAG: AMP-binding protein [Deltaproteobacteria bacterium]|jgi:long-chain acyl-CoA synthetase|nr:AMP-binding protein [Deltaproteobacteria bacterium]MBT6498318.1 AMP-binding protein [Deltaproteobacteria bacterium]MBT7716054.1 AMP-binding protein [Deltaproteobacteria bacterium]